MQHVPRRPPGAAPPASARRPSTKSRTDAAGAPLTSRGPGTSGELVARSRSEPEAWSAVMAPEDYAAFLSPHETEEVQAFPNVYCAGQDCAAKIMAPVANAPANYGYDDDRGDYIIRPRDHMMYRFEVLSVLGKGSFGQVVKAIDHKTGQNVAIKIIRNKKRFHQQAQIEIRILSHLRDRDTEGKYGIIRMHETFVFRNHVCLTYELLSMNLYEYMKLSKFHPMPLNIVKKIGASLLISLAFMWRENIIHCDLKPENILLRQPNRTGVKVIDLGSACFEDQRLYSYIQSRFYRAPEVILGMPYTKRIDLWSYACVLCELAVGYPLFPGENEVEQLACIMEMFDVPPGYLLDASPRRAHFFDTGPDGATYVPKLVPNSRKKVRRPRGRNLAAVLQLEEDDMFVDFIRMFLQWDPAERPAPEPAMRHPWICDAYVGVTARMPTVPRRAPAGLPPATATGTAGHSGGHSSSGGGAAAAGSNEEHHSTIRAPPVNGAVRAAVGGVQPLSSRGGDRGGSGGVTLPSIGATARR